MTKKYNAFGGTATNSRPGNTSANTKSGSGPGSASVSIRASVSIGRMSSGGPTDCSNRTSDTI